MQTTIFSTNLHLKKLRQHQTEKHTILILIYLPFPMIRLLWFQCTMRVKNTIIQQTLGALQNKLKLTRSLLLKALIKWFYSQTNHHLSTQFRYVTAMDNQTNTTKPQMKDCSKILLLLLTKVNLKNWFGQAVTKIQYISDKFQTSTLTQQFQSLTHKVQTHWHNLYTMVNTHLSANLKTCLEEQIKLAGKRTHTMKLSSLILHKT